MNLTIIPQRHKNYFVKMLWGICCFLLLNFTPDEPVRIFLVGDSTMADKPVIDNPEHGWGQMFPLFFTDDVQIFNHAKNGRSTKSFIAEGRWQTVYNQLKPGDYVFIQFGHNDAKKEDTTRFAAPRPDYKNNLKKFIAEARQKKAIPILLTSITRRDFDSKGNFKANHGEYPGVMKEVAVEENVPLIDMFEKTKSFVQSLGDEQSKKYYLAGVGKNDFRLWNKKRDDTHFTRFGAVKMASFVVEGIKELNLDLANKLIDPPSPQLVGEGKTIGLDYSLNNFLKLKKDSNKIFGKYSWEDSSEYGLTNLARMLDLLGADLDTLQTLPDDSLLKNFSIYIIFNLGNNEVKDERESIKVIDSWVEQGGVLVLLENDEGNFHSEYFNELAKSFGIEFLKNNSGNISEAKEVVNLPSSQIFSAQNLYYKNISSLKIEKPFEAILNNDEATLMASVKIGNGLVLACGNSWLLNNYLDPQHFNTKKENSKAAKNLFEWLLNNSHPPTRNK